MIKLYCNKTINATKYVGNEQVKSQTQTKTKTKPNQTKLKRNIKCIRKYFSIETFRRME